MGPLVRSRHTSALCAWHRSLVLLACCGPSGGVAEFCRRSSSSSSSSSSPVPSIHQFIQDQHVPSNPLKFINQSITICAPLCRHTVHSSPATPWCVLTPSLSPSRLFRSVSRSVVVMVPHCAAATRIPEIREWSVGPSLSLLSTANCHCTPLHSTLLSSTLLRRLVCIMMLTAK
jgi:hypothetical protein